MYKWNDITSGVKQLVGIGRFDLIAGHMLQRATYALLLPPGDTSVFKP